MTITPALRQGIRAEHFDHSDHIRHGDPTTTVEIDGDKILTPANLLTLVIRKDAAFATRSLRSIFKQTAGEVSLTAGEYAGFLAQFEKLLDNAYRAWGHAVVAATARSLDYDGKYGLVRPDNQHTPVHFHTADSLAGRVIKGAGRFVDECYSEQTPVLFVSLDDMIHRDVFDQYADRGAFAEIGFSRIFSLTSGRELGFIERPGTPSVGDQVQHVRDMVRDLRGSSSKRVPIVFLEDNVRRAKAPMWIINEMKRGGVFQDGEMAGIATCLAVAKQAERANLFFEQRQIPLIVGVDYSDSSIDVITPRDHLFDGFVVENKGKLGRLPSFMMDQNSLAANFKIDPKRVHTFAEEILEVNINFCATVENEAGFSPPLSAFVPGPTIAEVMGISPETPMKEVLIARRENAALVF